MVAATTVEGAARSRFRRDAEAWLAENVSEYWRQHRGALEEAEETRIRAEWDRKLYQGGYAGLSLPVEYGGQGLGLAEEVAFGELAARAQAPDGLGRIGKILTAPTLIAHGTEYQKSTYLQPILSGEHVWCQGFSEPGSGSDLASVACSARRVDGGFLVRGTKTWTSFSRHSHRCLLLARSDESAPRYRNLSLLLLDMHASGVEISPIQQISGSRHFSETHFDDVFVAEEDLVGEEGEGWKMAMTVLANERGAVEGITRYVEIRADMDLLLECCSQPGEAMEQLESLNIRVEIVRTQVSKAVSRQDDEVAFLRSAMVLKVMWSELWQELTSLAAKLSCPVHRAHWRHQYLESRSATIYSGTSEIQRNIIAERVLGLPK
ncbi:MAG: acyl-CoA dehydrogenase [Blastococcus sp.]|jgi:alkylation response protein AidB-like acyl-CoA dehydrogenase|nr:acyl-CoA dehydrogenase [Blastococcus sp.]